MNHYGTRNVMGFFDIVSSKRSTKESQTQVASNVIALVDITECRARNIHAL